MFSDKFYRIYTLYEYKTTTEPRSYNFKECDVSNVGQALTRVNHEFVQGKTKYNIMKTTNNNWDAKNKILKSIQQNNDLATVATLEQTLVYDKKVNKFLFNNNYFDLNNALVADNTQLSGFRRMDGNEYLPENYVFKNGKYVTSSNGNRYLIYNKKDGGKFISRDELRIE